MNIYDIHKNNPDVFQQLSLKDQLFLYYKCPQTEQIIKLYSNYNQLAFTISGKRIIHHGDNKWVLDEDNGFLMKRCAFLQELPGDYSEWEVLVMYLEDKYLKNVFEDLRAYLNLENLPDPEPGMIQVIHMNENIRNAAYSLLPYFNRSHQLPETIFEGKFRELLFNILAHPENRNILAHVNQIASGYRIPVWEVMEANYMYNLTISEFAEIAHRSTATFRREFEAYFHTTPGKWLTEKRLARAELLLRTTSRQISDITFDSGFANVSHFSRIFKKKFGESPTSYRQKHGKSAPA